MHAIDPSFLHNEWKDPVNWWDLTSQIKSIDTSQFALHQWKRCCKAQTYLWGQYCTTAETESGRDEEAWSTGRWGDRRCCAALWGGALQLPWKKKEGERDAASIRLSAQGTSNWIRHAIWSGGVQLEQKREAGAGQTQWESSLRQTKRQIKGRTQKMF